MSDAQAEDVMGLYEVEQNDTADRISARFADLSKQAKEQRFAFALVVVGDNVHAQTHWLGFGPDASEKVGLIEMMKHDLLMTRYSREPLPKTEGDT